MKNVWIAVAALNVSLSVLSLSVLICAAQAAEPSCDRACLEGFVDQYLAALVAQDPSRLPLAKNARYTENGQELKLGDGMWGLPLLSEITSSTSPIRRPARWASSAPLRNMDIR
jgi:hypothetical protein